MVLFDQETPVSVPNDALGAFVPHVEGKGSLRWWWLRVGRCDIPNGGQSSAHLVCFEVEVERRILDVL